jgi:hypothetical protein
VVVVDDLRTVGRQAHQERAWRQAAETLRVADSVEGLDPENLAMLAEAAFLSGDVTGCLQAYERAFAGHAARGASRAAARSAIGIGRALAMKGRRRPREAGSLGPHGCWTSPASSTAPSVGCC